MFDNDFEVTEQRPERRDNRRDRDDDDRKPTVKRAIRVDVERRLPTGELVTYNRATILNERLTERDPNNTRKKIGSCRIKLTTGEVVNILDSELTYWVTRR